MGQMPKHNECEINCILEKESESALVCDKPSPPTLILPSSVCSLLLRVFFKHKHMVAGGVAECRESKCNFKYLDLT